MTRTAITCLALTIFLLPLARPVSAAETTADQARQLVGGWLALHGTPLDAKLGGAVASIETFYSRDGAAVYHVVALEPAGFVIVAGDDLVEPIIAFAEIGAYDPTTDNPLHALVAQDLPRRVADVRDAQGQRVGLPQQALDAQAKWQMLSDGPGGRSGAPPQDIDDPRVGPLLQTRWDQSTTFDGGYCYNYYTPNHYLTGCGATAVAQLMRYHGHPTSGVGMPQFLIRVDGAWQYASLRGGNGAGGPYDWSNMVGVPDDGCTDVQRQAIGALCYDTGVAMGSSYSADVTTSAWGSEVAPLRSTFGYSNVIYGSGISQGVNLQRALEPDLDAAYPVFLDISATGQSITHFIVCDGYGYNAGTSYHHVNFGWSGSWSAWYNLPAFGGTGYNGIHECTYNVFPTGSGEIISGRVTTIARIPISGATVTAVAAGGATYQATTNSRGIYALAKIPPTTQYTITATHPEYAFVGSQVVTTGNSGGSAAGNVWGVDFVASGPAPVAEDIRLMMRHGTAKAVTLVGWDDGLPNPPGALSYIITSLPAIGTLSDPQTGLIASVPHTLASAGKVATYTAPANQGGTVAFNYIVNDGGTPPNGGDSGTATVTIDLVYVPTGVLYVDARATGRNDGLDWANACQNVQDAVARAACVGASSEVHVAQGTYRPDQGAFQRAGSRSASFHLLNGVTIKGGYAGIGAADPSARDVTAWETVLSGDLLGNDGPNFTNRDDNASHVVDGSGCDATAILDGATIKSGHSQADTGGAGVFVYAGSPIIRDCTITENVAAYSGGGLYADGNVTVQGCTFGNNQAYDAGGGAYVYAGTLVMQRCTFANNTATTAGALYLSSVEGASAIGGCAFEGNESVAQAGAVYVYDASPTMMNCSFVGNVAGGRGGGIRNNSASPSLVNCLFTGNSAAMGGGAVNDYESSPLSVNCTFAANTTAATGGGIYSTSGSSPIIRNSTFWGNTQQGAGSVESAQIYLDGVSATVTRSCIQDADPNDGSIPFGGAANGNIDDNPRFDPDYHLSAGSPCIDAGDNSVVPLDTLDLDGDGNTTERLPLDLAMRARFVNDPTVADTGAGTPPIVDMGAYEYMLAGDCNLDWIFNFADFTSLAACMLGPATDVNWGCNCTDFDLDGDIDLADFAALQRAFAP